MKLLLDKINILDYKYSLIRKDNCFNIFSLLRKKNEEVLLHSRFIAELLNPNGTHGEGYIFLDLFLEIISDNFDNNYHGLITVEYEEYIGEINENYTKGGRIDIIIKHKDKPPIIIENKIDADDQPNQLLRYHNHNPDSPIYYLTLFGLEPSDQALGGVSIDKIKLLSYRYDINKWISRCIEKASTKHGLRETLIQYLDLVNELTGNDIAMEEREEIIKLLGENENIISARKIVDNWIHVRWHVEMGFWIGLEDIVKSNNYKVLDNQKYSADYITGVIHSSRNRDPWYGIIFKICEYDNTDVLLMVERSFGNLNYGLRVDGDNKELLLKVNKLISHLYDKTVNEWLSGIKYFTTDINFETFSSNTTLNLCNIDKREEIISDCWEQVNSFINSCKKILDSNHST